MTRCGRAARPSSMPAARPMRRRSACAPGRTGRAPATAAASGSPEARLSRILKRPNSYQSPTDFFLYLTDCLYGEGAAFALALRNNRSEIVELHLMDPARCSARRRGEWRAVLRVGRQRDSRPAIRRQFAGIGSGAGARRAAYPAARPAQPVAGLRAAGGGIAGGCRLECDGGAGARLCQQPGAAERRLADRRGAGEQGAARPAAGGVERADAGHQCGRHADPDERAQVGAERRQQPRRAIGRDAPDIRPAHRDGLSGAAAAAQPKPGTGTAGSAPRARWGSGYRPASASAPI